MNSLGLTLVTSAFNHLQQQNKNKQFSSLEPISCCIRIALLPLLPHGTKLGFGTVRLKFHLPELWQGIVRWNSGDSRRDVDRLMKPILRMTSRADPERDGFLLMKIKEGLDVLLDTYSTDGGTISYTIRMYSALIQSRIQGQDIQLEDPTTDIYQDLWKSHEISLISSMMQNAYNDMSSKQSQHSHLQAIKSLLHNKEAEAKVLFHNFCSQL